LESNIKRHSTISDAVQAFILLLADESSDIGDPISSAEEFFKERAAQQIEHDQSTDSSAKAMEMLDKDDNEILPTLEESFVIQILKKSNYFLSADFARLRLISLQIISKGIPLLKGIPKELNPIIHLVWDSCVLKLKDPEQYICNEALRTISAISISSPEFVRSRISNDILGFLSKKLKSIQYNPNNLTKNTKNMVKSTFSRNEIKYFMECLNLLEIILESVIIKPKYQNEFIGILINFVNCQYDLQYVEKSIEILRKLTLKNGPFIHFLISMALGATTIPKRTGSYVLTKKDLEMKPIGSIDDFKYLSRIFKDLKGPGWDHLSSLYSLAFNEIVQR
jgi:hypothetical protein